MRKMTKFTFVNSECSYIYFVLFSDFSICLKYLTCFERTKKKMSTSMDLNIGRLIRQLLVETRDASTLS